MTDVREEFTSSLCSLINKLQHLEKLYIKAQYKLGVNDLQFDVCAPVLQKVRIVARLKEFPNWVAKLQNLVRLSLGKSCLTDDPLPLLKDRQIYCIGFFLKTIYETGSVSKLIATGV